MAATVEMPNYMAPYANLRARFGELADSRDDDGLLLAPCPGCGDGVASLDSANGLECSAGCQHATIHRALVAPPTIVTPPAGDTPVSGPAPAAAPSRAHLLGDLTARLGLGEAGVSVTDAQVFGGGPTARVHIALSDGRKIRFEKFALVANGQQLAAHLLTHTGIVRPFRNADAAIVASRVFHLAQASDEDTDEITARAWGREYLRTAPTQDVAMDDTLARWQAFSALEALNPAAITADRRDAESYAACTLVLVDSTTGLRHVRAGWLQSYVGRRHDGGTYSPPAVASLMLSVGWSRTGKTGRIKATRPKARDTLVWPFLTVPVDWDAEGEC